MRCEVVAVGTELLLGQIVDTNSAWIGEQSLSPGSTATTRPVSVTTSAGSSTPCGGPSTGRTW